MPGPKSRTPVKSVVATKPEQVHPADSADPGEMNKLKSTQQAQKQGKYGEIKAKAYKPPPIAVSSEQKHAKSKSQKAEQAWVGITLVDEAGHPVAGQPYTITLPDGSVKKGTTNTQGQAMITGFDSGDCVLTLQQLDATAW